MRTPNEVAIDPADPALPKVFITAQKTFLLPIYTYLLRLWHSSVGKERTVYRRFADIDPHFQVPALWPLRMGPRARKGLA